MKKYIVPIILVAILAMGFLFSNSDRARAQVMTKPQADQVKTIPEVIILGQQADVGKVTFNHVKHNSGEYSFNGKIACIECHHTAQPASVFTKQSPFKTSWPARRTTTLTGELFAKDPSGAGVAACRDCHARTGEKPKLMAEIPLVKIPDSTDVAIMTNQMAFHRACDACHFQISMNRADSKVPRPTECWTCHKRPAS